LRSYGGLKSPNFRGVFLENDPLLETFQHSILKGFIATQIDVLGSNVVKFGKWEMGKVVRYLPDKQNSPRSADLAAERIVHKIRPRQCA